MWEKFPTEGGPCRGEGVKWATIKFNWKLFYVFQSKQTQINNLRHGL